MFGAMLSLQVHDRNGVLNVTDMPSTSFNGCECKGGREKEYHCVTALDS